MTDYVVKFSGQDNLSGTINNIKSELNDVGKSSTALDQIITVPLKTERVL